MAMKARTRDNLIYLAAGLGIATLVAIDFFFADSHDQKMLWPSKFAFRAVYTTLLLAYFVAKETWELKATLTQALAYILLASFLHLGIVLTFRRIATELSGMTFAVLAVFEMFLVFQLVMAVIRYLRIGDSRA